MRSAVAGIVDASGGLRVVVEKPWMMRLHVAPGERLFILPGLRVKEPLSWADGLNLAERVEAFVASRR